MVRVSGLTTWKSQQNWDSRHDFPPDSDLSPSIATTARTSPCPLSRCSLPDHHHLFFRSHRLQVSLTVGEVCSRYHPENGLTHPHVQIRAEFVDLFILRLWFFNFLPSRAYTGCKINFISLNHLINCLCLVSQRRDETEK